VDEGFGLEEVYEGEFEVVRTTVLVVGVAMVVARPLFTIILCVVTLVTYVDLVWIIVFAGRVR
jgi:hypothetical protein